MATLTVVQNTNSRRQILLTANGLITENFERLSATTSALLTTQRVTYMLAGFRAGDVVANLHCILNTAGSDPGGTGYARMGLYNTAGTLLASSGDARALFVGTTGILTVPLSATYTITADAGYYIAFLTVLDTTQPKLGCTNGGGVVGIAPAVGSGAGLMNVQLSQSVLPTPTASFTASVINPYWVGAS